MLLAKFFFEREGEEKGRERAEKKWRYHDRNKVHATTPLWAEPSEQREWSEQGLLVSLWDRRGRCAIAKPVRDDKVNLSTADRVVVSRAREAIKHFVRDISCVGYLRTTPILRGFPQFSYRSVEELLIATPRPIETNCKMIERETFGRKERQRLLMLIATLLLGLSVIADCSRKGKFDNGKSCELAIEEVSSKIEFCATIRLRTA
ncbi:hypothetical protein WN51_12701 [Melipona quadrifasciata]|uniref:Uncharacterized protein n=1 Tax=Melipona quadrifasciata TaxID=166423 RepID=A0A0M9A2C6_9HYME|nr:hypothetical protein WN51_12701 [Melipona quadrifasciata]